MSNKSVDLKAAIGNLDSLPTMPVVAQKILRLPLDTSDGEARLLQLIEQDPLIAARIIGLANSPLFGTSRRITSVGDAALILGLTRVKSVSVGIAVISTLNRHPTGRLNMQDLWLHSLGVALAMRALAHAMPFRARPPEDEIFLAGLLHDIGFMVLQHIAPELSDQLHAILAADTLRPVYEIEDATLGIGHGELGAELARHWDLPGNIVAVLRYHHHAGVAAAAEGLPLIALLGLAEKLLPAFGIAEHVPADIHPQDWLALDIDPARADELTATVREQAEQARLIANTN